MPAAVASSTGARRTATSSRASARIPPSPTRTTGPNDGSRRPPRIELDAGRAAGRRGGPRRVASAGSGSARSVGGGAPHRGRVARARAGRAPTSLLWPSPIASTFRTTGNPIRCGRLGCLVGRRPRPSVSRPAAPRAASRARLSRSGSDAGRRCRRTRRRAATSCVVARADPRRGRASSSRTGPSAQAAIVRGLPAGDRGDRPERLDRAAEHGHAAGRAQGVDDLGRRLAGGERHEDRQEVRPIARSPGGAAPTTSSAVSTSDGSERYGKSWTRASTSYAPEPANARKAAS